MSNQTPPPDSVDELRDLFGYYCTIEMKRHGVANEHYQHKIIGKFKSNTWVETPIQSPAKATIHNYQEDVVYVICCGVVEETVYRVRLSDIKNIHNHFIRTEKLKLLAEVKSEWVKFGKGTNISDGEYAFLDIIEKLRSEL
jgi:hypothetical protein